jgi:inositol-phosphate phosphatase / L-galactose 1-phosphate phosphatase / histidinol-phosphatase
MIDFALSLADAARSMVAAAALPNPETKPDRSFVTETDRAVEDLLRQMIADRFPAHGILGEEGQDVAPGADHVWVLDPIDGTAAFVAGVPMHGTLIALAQGGVPVLGIIDMHVTGQRWVGAAGRPTMLHHAGRITPCATRKGQPMDRAILSASNPDFFTAPERPALDALRAVTAWRVWGASCMAYGLLASGRTDLALDTALAVHDWAPFAPIIEGAGGRVTDWQGRALRLDSGPQVLAAGDPLLHDRARALIAG